jgi:hypothetical protein
MYNILKQVAEDTGLTFYIGDNMLHNKQSIRGVYPAIFVKYPTVQPIDYPQQSNFDNISLSYMVVAAVNETEFMLTEQATLNHYVEQMKAKEYEFRKRLAAYTVNNVAIFRTNDAWQVTINYLGSSEYKLLDNFVAGVVVDLKLKMYNLETLCI